MIVSSWLTKDRENCCKRYLDEVAQDIASEQVFCIMPKSKRIGSS